jgi:O-methyltransferase domain/Dimerisation domain
MPDPTLAPDQILELGHAYRGAKTLLSAVEFGVFTVLAEGPTSLESLSRHTGVHERGARDFFDALVALGMLRRDEAGNYANTPETAFYLDRNKPSYIGGELEHFSAYVFPHWSFLTEALRTGQPQSGKRATGHYAALYADRSSLERLAKGMTGGTLPVAKMLAHAFPWKSYDTLLDVGTAQGCLPVQIALAHPHLGGGGFDLLPVRPLFEDYVREHGLADRLQFFPGDFVNDALPNADVIVLGRILHNWDLSTKKLLLRKVYDALPPGGALIVYERLIDDERRVNASALLASLNMLIMTAGGFDFTAADCFAWMREAGFRDLRLAPLAGEFSMIAGLK